MGSSFHFLSQQDVWDAGFVVPRDPGYFSLLAGLGSRTDGDQVRINLNGDVKPQPSRPILFCWIRGGHRRNSHPRVQGRQNRGWGSRRGHGHRGSPRASRACPPGAPARASERSLLSRNASEHPEIGAWLFAFHFFWGGLSPFMPLFYFLFAAKSAQDSYLSLFPLGVRWLKLL